MYFGLNFLFLYRLVKIEFYWFRDCIFDYNKIYGRLYKDVVDIIVSIFIKIDYLY